MVGMKEIDKDAMAKAYVECGSMNLGISNYCLECEGQGYNKGVEYIAIQSSN
jgi:hypothetical protein